MNENLNLVEILKDCPKGTKLYSTIFGEVKLYKVKDNNTYPIGIEDKEGVQSWLTSNGKFMERFDGECILFPSREQRDWSKFKDKKPKFKVGDRIRHKETNKDDVYEISKVYDDSYGIAGFTWMIYKKYQDQYELVPNKFDPNTLKPFDKVLVRDDRNEKWQCSLFSYININDDIYYPYVAINTGYKCCIPYNEETKHLLGTTKEAPEYYRYWEG